MSMHKLKSRFATDRINTKPTYEQTIDHLPKVNATTPQMATTLLANKEHPHSSKSYFKKTITVSLPIVP